MVNYFYQYSFYIYNNILYLYLIKFLDEGELQELTTVCKKFYAEQTAEKQLQELDLKGHYSKPMSSLLEVHPTLNKPEVF